MDNLEVYVNIPVEEFPLICRICLVKGKLQSFRESLVKIFYNLTDIQVEPEEDLPSNICLDCTSKLEDISKFIDSSKLNDAGLRRTLQVKKQSYSEECEESADNDAFDEDLDIAGRNLKLEDQSVDSDENKISESASVSEFSDKFEEVSSETKQIGEKKRSSTSEIKKFHCLHCQKTFATRSKLKVHLIAHSEEEQFECKLCGKKFKFSQNLVRHSNSVHKDLKPFSCEICHKDIDTDLEEHMDTHFANNIEADEMRLLTRIKDEILLNDDVFELEICRDEPEEPIRKNYCAECDESFNLQFQYKIHMRKHQEKELNDETSCGKYFTISENDSGHIADVYTCEVCGKNYKKKENFDSHSKIHSDQRDYECEDCGITFKILSYYNRHMRDHQVKKDFLCWVCGKKFRKLRLLNVHMRIHNGEKPYCCRLCGKRFTQNSTLHLHLRNHTGERNFRCSICDQAFIQHHHLLDHVKLKHTNEKGYECKYCAKEFSLKSSLNRHNLIHTGVKPHACSVCGSGFRETRQLRKHAKWCAK